MKKKIGIYTLTSGTAIHVSNGETNRQKVILAQFSEDKHLGTGCCVLFDMFGPQKFIDIDTYKTVVVDYTPEEYLSDVTDSISLFDDICDGSDSPEDIATFIPDEE